MVLTVPQGTYQHGTNAKYVFEKCRCEECKRANAFRVKRLKLEKLKGGPNTRVDAEPVRKHVKRLQKQGMGWKRIAEEAGISKSIVMSLLYGRGERATGPSKVIAKKNADALLAVRLKLTDRQKMVPVKEAWLMISDIMALGYSEYWIAQQLGLTGNSLQLHGKTCITVATHKRIESLWHRTATPRVAKAHHEKVAVTRAKQRAEAIRNQWETRRCNANVSSMDYRGGKTAASASSSPES